MLAYVVLATRRIVVGNGNCSGKFAVGIAYDINHAHNVDAFVGFPCSVGQLRTMFNSIIFHNESPTHFTLCNAPPSSYFRTNAILFNIWLFAVTGAGSFDKCGRWSQRSWVLVLEVCGSTRTRGYGSGTGTKSTGAGIPVFTRKEHHFSRCWSYTYIECFLFLPY